MKKINLVSGFGAKFAVAAFAVAGLTLTSCEKESFDVNVPNITIKVPEVTIPDQEAGVAYVILSTTSANGNTLDGVDYYEISNDGGEKQSESLYKFTGAGSLQIRASKDGYETVIKTQVVPAPQKGSYQTYNMNFVLNALTDDVTIEEGPDGNEIDPETTPVPEVPETPDYPNLSAGSHTVNVPVATGIAYTAEQLDDLRTKVNQLTGPVVGRSADDEAEANLLSAKGALREKINALNTSFATTYLPVTFELSEAASNVTINIVPTYVSCDVTLAVIVGGQRYAVSGQGTKVTENTVESITADGVDVSHDHDHGHGEGDAGGGTSGK